MKNWNLFDPTWVDGQCRRQGCFHRIESLSYATKFIISSRMNYSNQQLHFRLTFAIPIIAINSISKHLDDDSTENIYRRFERERNGWKTSNIQIASSRVESWEINFVNFALCRRKKNVFILVQQQVNNINNLQTLLGGRSHSNKLNFARFSGELAARHWSRWFSEFLCGTKHICGWRVAFLSQCSPLAFLGQVRVKPGSWT